MFRLSLRLTSRSCIADTADRAYEKTNVIVAEPLGGRRVVGGRGDSVGGRVGDMETVTKARTGKFGAIITGEWDEAAMDKVAHVLGRTLARTIFDQRRYVVSLKVSLSYDNESVFVNREAHRVAGFIGLDNWEDAVIGEHVNDASIRHALEDERGVLDYGEKDSDGHQPMFFLSRDGRKFMQGVVWERVE